MRRQATRSALSSRITDNGIVVVSSLQPEQPRTKSMIAALGNIDVAGKVLLIDERLQEDTTRSARNIPGVTFKPASVINIIDVLDNDVLLFSVDGIRQLERILTDGDV
jgi:large subunit ribosomal protein L4